MKIVSALCPLLAMLMSLAACGHNSPVAKDVVEPPGNLVGDLAANGMATPANAAASERVARARLPVPSDGMHWHWDELHQAAVFGPSITAPAFSISCEEGQIAVRRVDAAPQGGKGTISFTGNGHAASLPALAVGSGFASSWLADAAPSDSTRAVGRVFAGPDPVEIALTGTAKLITGASPIPAKAFAACSS